MNDILKHHRLFGGTLPSENQSPKSVIVNTLIEAFFNALIQNPDILITELKGYPDLAAYLKENL